MKLGLLSHYIETLRRETKAWEVRRNTEAKQVDWQWTTNDARIRLKRLYIVNFRNFDTYL